MSSLRNAVKRSTHKERAQPAARHKYGLLEKKKDYLKRARHHQKHEAVLQVLREKAEGKNPDEFYQAMQRDQLHGADTKKSRMSDKEIRSLKTQDLLHVQLASSRHNKRLEKLRRDLHFIGAPAASQHTVFVDSPGEVRSFDAAQHFDTPEELLGRTFNRPRHGQLDDEAGTAASAPVSAPRLTSKQAKRTAVAYQRLLEQQQTADRLKGTAIKLAAKRAAGGKGSKRQVEPPNGVSGVKQVVFKRVRQR
mmetsp:Transcript_15380/g.46432  ORF Transcript_15380/g.46432 Transcript_15380/m.46432 type:complete len:250 (+) Transcript_15380:51-800(+)